ncbi:unnamed protein product, partial [Candidula unifasciata]
SHTDLPQKCALKVRVPVKEPSRYNFVMGRGSMREKDKEEELRKEGGKYAHLNEDLHVLVECYAEITDGYNRLALALAELKKFLIPEMTDDVYGGGDDGDMGMNGAPRGRGGYRGGPPEREVAVVPGRGALLSRGGGPPPRGAPRGAPSSRGHARGAVYGYGSGGYDSYDDSYGYGSGVITHTMIATDMDLDSNHDYGDGSTSGDAGYDSYSGSKAAPPATRCASRSQSQSHPYTRAASGDY